jgi:deoxycytidylate deaminase
MKLIDEIINFITADENFGSIINKNNTTTSEEISKTFAKILSKTDIRNLLEYSRAVHAGMHAIIKGSQLTGDKMKNGKLFVTTYLCHHCARHILLAGIKEIYYIEPYAKSLCLSLHNGGDRDRVTQRLCSIL